MKTKQILALLCVLAMVVPSFAKDKKHQDASALEGTRDVPGQSDAKKEKSEKTTLEATAKPSGKEPWVNVNVQIGPQERQVIQNYVTDYNSKPGKKDKGLPPGLAKKVARGGKLPPGWQKKCVRGEIMPEPVFKQCRPLPPEIIVKLPPPPVGTILITVEGKIVRLAKATREILDVFDLRG
jgi:hypothetical protein